MRTILAGLIPLSQKKNCVRAELSPVKYQANPVHLQDQEQREQLCSESGRNSFNSTTRRSMAATSVLVMLLLREAGEMGSVGLVWFSLDRSADTARVQ